MSDTKISALIEETTVHSSDYLPIVDESSTPATKKISVKNLLIKQATITIAPVGAGGADYYCTGTNDQVVINTALSALPATGGRIVLLDGTYSISGSITIPHSYITIEGQGWGTNLSVANSTNANIINFSPSTGNVMSGIMLRNIQINANGANQTSGDTIYGLGAIFCRFENIHIVTPYANGIHLYNDNIGNYGHHNVVTGCLVENGTSSAGNGIAVYLDQSDENVIANNTFQSNGRAAATTPYHIYDVAGLNTIVNNQFVTGGMAIKAQGGNSKIIGNSFDGCGGTDAGVSRYSQVHVTGGEIIVAKNHFYNIGFGGSANNSVGLLLDDTNAYCAVVGNIFTPLNNTTNARAGIDMATYPPTQCLIVDNVFTLTESGTATWGTAPITMGGTGHIINNNMGVNTVSAVTTTYTVTPLDQLIKADATSGAFTVTLPDATKIPGYQTAIKKIDASANAITVATTSSQTIDGVTTYSLSARYATVRVISDGANWQIISKI